MVQTSIESKAHRFQLLNPASQHMAQRFDFSVRCTQVRFASFKTGGFITTTVHSESTGMKTVKSHLCGLYYLVNPPNEKMTNTPLCRLVYQACDLASIQAVKQSNFHPSIEFNITYQIHNNIKVIYLVLFLCI